MKHKYPIGTAIRYFGSCEECKGKSGKIVGVFEDYCHVSLPTSNCVSGDRAYAKWAQIVLLVKKNQQLLFDFMSE
jgi:hypothetical protein